jgi:hypothetical protein
MIVVADATTEAIPRFTHRLRDAITFGDFALPALKSLAKFTRRRRRETFAHSE